MRTQPRSFIGFSDPSYQQDADNRTEPGVQSGEGGGGKWDDWKGKPPNNANHLLLSFFSAPTYMIVMALQHLEEAAWLLTIINLFSLSGKAEIDGGWVEGRWQWRRIDRMPARWTVNHNFAKGKQYILSSLRVEGIYLYINSPSPPQYRNWRTVLEIRFCLIFRVYFSKASPFQNSLS